MIAVLNLAVEAVETRLATDPSTSVDVAEIAARAGTTEHHLRRMFASLAGMPLSEYVRRRRMSLAASDLVGTGEDLLTIAVRYGYGPTRHQTSPARAGEAVVFSRGQNEWSWRESNPRPRASNQVFSGCSLY